MTIQVCGDRFAQQKEITEKLMQDAAAHTVDNPKIVLNPYGQAPLTAVLCFSTQFPEQFIVSVNGYRWLTEKTVTHLLPIVALRADADNTVHLLQNDILRKKLTIHPDALPNEVATASGLITEPNTLFLSLPADDHHFPAAYDGEGECLWIFTQRLSHFWKRLANGHFLTGSAPNVAPPYGPTAIWEMDLLGRLYAEYRLPGGAANDAVELPDGNLVVISQLPDSGTAMDELVWVDRKNGEIIKTLSLQSVLTPGFGSPGQSGSDWCHLSSLRYDDKENLLWLTAEMANAVIAVDAATAEVRKVFINVNRLHDRLDFIKTDKVAQVDMIHEPASLYLKDGRIFVLMSNRFMDNKCAAPLSIISLNDLNGYVEGERVIDDALRSPILNNVVAFGEGYIFHGGGFSDGPSPQTGLFAKFDYPNLTLWSEGVFLSETHTIQSRYRIEAASYGLWPLALSSTSFSGVERGVLGQWGEPVKVDVNLPISAEEEDVSDLALSLCIDAGRLIVSATYFQGEATALILRKGDERLQYFIQSNRRPYGAQWLYSDTERPERYVRWAIPLPESPGQWQIGLWIDGIFYHTKETIMI